MKTYRLYIFLELLKITPAPNNGTLGTLNHILRSPNPLPTPHTTVSQSCHNGTTSATDICFCSASAMVNDFYSL